MSSYMYNYLTLKVYLCKRLQHRAFSNIKKGVLVPSV